MIVRSGATTVTDTVFEALLLFVTVSPPPETLAVLVMEAGALAAILTLSVISGAETPAGMVVLRVQLATVLVEAAQSHPVPNVIVASVKPVGKVSVTV